MKIIAQYLLFQIIIFNLKKKVEICFCDKMDDKLKFHVENKWNVTVDVTRAWPWKGHAMWHECMLSNHNGSW